MKCFSLCNKFIMFIIERISGLSLFLLTFFVFKHNIIQCTLLLCKTAYKLKCINAIPAPYLLRIQEIKPTTDQVRFGYRPGTEQARDEIYFRKSARMGAKQSIRTPGSKQIQPCNMSGSI